MYEKQIRWILAVGLLLFCVGCERAEESKNPEHAGSAAETLSTMEQENTADTFLVPFEEERSAPSEQMLGDLPPIVKVDGILYYDTGRQSTLLRCGVPDGSIESEVKSTEIPKEDRQSNFGTGYGYQTEPDGCLAVEIDGKWMVFESRKNLFLFHGIVYDQAELSEETLAWLTWYNGLSGAEQLAISSVPPELLDKEGKKTEDANAQ